MANLWLFAYVIFSIFAIIGGIKYFYDASRNIAAFIYLIGALTLLIIFGKRWFEGNNAVFSNAAKKWPPFVNTCPDYLTFHLRDGISGEAARTCIDKIGVSTNGGLPVYSENNKSQDSTYFSLATSASSPEGKLAELCARAKEKGLTWEGVTDGESCYTPAGTAAAGGAGASQC